MPGKAVAGEVRSDLTQDAFRDADILGDGVNECPVVILQDGVNLHKMPLTLRCIRTFAKYCFGSLATIGNSSKLSSAPYWITEVGKHDFRSLEFASQPEAAHLSTTILNCRLRHLHSIVVDIQFHPGDRGIPGSGRRYSMSIAHSL